jgi:succinate-semialdehyde dehydrogenase/glutarate-semialdehyde dehydrogenase
VYSLLPKMQGSLRMTVRLVDRLADPSLLRGQAYLAGLWCDADSGQRFAVTNPSSGDILIEVPDMGRSETARAIDAAHAAQKQWSRLSGAKRGKLLRRWFDLLMENQADLATILTAEMGKPLAEAMGEVAYGAAYIEWFAEEARRIYGDIIPSPAEDKRLMVIKQPVGVVGTITPWNFPIAMIARKVAPALAVGCTCISKPAGQTPLSALAMAHLAERAGIPPGVFSVVTSNSGAQIGVEFCENPKVRKVSFTGSTQVGRVLMRQCADQIKKVSLELGGNAPFIVFDDADIDAAVEGAIQSKFRNAGQTCVCTNRIYVQAGIYDEFARKLSAAVDQLKVGDGFAKGVAIGPLIDTAATRKVLEHIDEAVSKGARLLRGGKIREGTTFVEPAVLVDVRNDMTVAKEETFGPIAPILRFDSIDEVIEMANDTIYGLAAYFYTRDTSRIFAVSEALEYGIVGINTGLVSTEVAPFGGVKQSGSGREGSKYGVDDYLDLKYMCIGGVQSP